MIAKKTSHPRPSLTGSKWSSNVTLTCDALTLDVHLFTKSAAVIAQSLKRTAETSQRRKSTPLRSAMSMLTFYANRAGKKLKPAQRRKIEQAKEELRKLFRKTAT